MRAEDIAEALSGRKIGAGWMARCPAHEDRTPSLSIRETPDGKVLVHCFVCDQARVIAALRQLGLWDELRPNTRQLRCHANYPADRTDEQRSNGARRIWERTQPGDNTLVEIYLGSRGITVPLSQDLRFHSMLKHPSGTLWPAMVARVTGGVDGMPQAIHRTFLSRDGGGKAPVDPSRMMLGPCRGGVVRLAPAGELVLIGEGIETSMAAMQATGYPAWAALSTSGLVTLNLPREVRNLVVLADGDDPGEAAAQTAAMRWKREGRRVRIARAPQGSDFNDLLKDCVCRAKAERI